MIYHKPALLQEVIAYLKPRAGGSYIDATVGGGGHTRAILEIGAKVLAIDRDPDAINFIKTVFSPELLKNLALINGNFSNIGEIAKENGFSKVDGIIIDLGTSSHQLETPKRGFSFVHEGPLDMRMDPTLNITAENIVNNFDERRLYEIFKTYGQEKYSRSIARAIISARQIEPIRSTKKLANIIQNEVSRSVRTKSRIHKATKVFQALRIVVNSELLNLNECLPQTASLLEKGGRLVIISFHSLEDGIVKRFFKGNENFSILTEKPVGPKTGEIEVNPRVRSAKLRAAEKI